MTTPQLLSFTDQNQLNSRLAADILETLHLGLQQRDRVTLVVSGGRTPAPLFEKLASMEFPWEKVTLTLADERWVNPESPDSNEHLVRTRLLHNNAAAASFIGLINNADTPHDAEPEINDRIAALPKPFSMVLLGLGEDGHTASLFPGSPELENALSPDSGKLCSGITPTNAPYKRMTLTLAALLCSEKIVLHITGNDKLRVYRQALGGTDVCTMPIRAFLQQQKVPVATYWAP